MRQFAGRIVIHCGFAARTYFSALTLIPFKPQTNFLSIINMGNHYALAQRGRWSLSGFLPWRYKHYIDEKFMAQFK